MTEEHSTSLSKRYFSNGNYLITHILVGLVLLLLCAGLFAVLAKSISAKDPIVQFDTVVVNAIHANTSPTLIPIMVLISTAGYELTLLITAIIVVFLIRKRDWPDVVLFVVAVVGAQILEELIKPMFQRARPTFANPSTLASGFGFPSGHAMGAMVFYGLIAYLLIRREKEWLNRVLIILSCVLIVLLVGFSRLYLGVHYPSDVMGGYIVGLAWLALTTSAVEIYRKRHIERQQLKHS